MRSDWTRQNPSRTMLHVLTGKVNVKFVEFSQHASRTDTIIVAQRALRKTCNKCAKHVRMFGFNETWLVPRRTFAAI
jgi:hypothetical protein